MKSHRAYLIDPEKQVITLVQLDGTVEHMHKLMGCELFTLGARFHNGDTIYVDDEGLLKGDDILIHLFRVNERKVRVSNPTPLAGKALLCGCNERTGESTDPLITIDQLRRVVVWLGSAAIESGVNGFEVMWHNAETEEVL